MGMTMKAHRNQYGMTLIELLIVVAIIMILAMVGSPLLIRFKNHRMVSAGIDRVYQLKKAVDEMAKECGGYPIRNLGDSFAQFRAIIDRKKAGGMLPYKFPLGTKCSSTSLQEYIHGSGATQSNLLISTCEIGSPGCAGQIHSGVGEDFNGLFVGDAGGPGNIAQNCNVSTGGNVTGWNYVLITDTTNPTNKPIPVVCANVIFKDSSVTVLLNGGGVDGGRQVTDGSGTLGPDGNVVPNFCPCGAWCSNNDSADTGCCDDCVDTLGVKHSGMGFKY
jgi:prepilin-type N-terminal cleavage/methylation domain-containing protein